MKLETTNNRFYHPLKLQAIKKIMIAMMMLFFIASCSKESGGTPPIVAIDCSGAAKTFAGDVRPLIQASCGGCHGTGSVNGPGPLTSFTEISNAKAAIRSAVLSGAMPQNSTLSAAQKNTIICWIDNGAPNN